MSLDLLRHSLLVHLQFFYYMVVLAISLGFTFLILFEVFFWFLVDSNIFLYSVVESSHGKVEVLQLGRHDGSFNILDFIFIGIHELFDQMVLFLPQVLMLQVELLLDFFDL